MNTWTFERSVCALFLGLTLAGCEAGDGLALFSAGSPSNKTSEAERLNVALRSADMMRGGLQLQPPDGFCIDKRGLRQDFALMARCDSLGGRGGALDAPLGLITVAITPVDGTPDLEDLSGATLPDGSDILSRSSGADFRLLQVSGGDVAGAADVHWRGLAHVGPYLVGLQAHGPEGSLIPGPAGAALLGQLVVRTKDASVALDVARVASES